MYGLEKILDTIKSEAELNAKSIISEAEEKAKEILLKADEDSVQIVSTIEQRAEEKCREIIDRAKSSAELTRAQNLLRRKRELIDDIINQSKQQLINLPDKEYFSCMSKLIDKNSSGKGEIIFNAKDRKRLPSDFDLKGNTVSDKTGDFDGGFILDYGDIEVNCTISAIFESSYDELSDIVNGILFRGV